MPSDCTLWYNPRCSTCQRALALLREQGVEPELRRYLEEPPTPAEIEDLLGKLGLPPHAVARIKEDEYQALRLSERTPREEMVLALAQHPHILQRPILVRGERAVVGRPPERVLELLRPAPGPEPGEGGSAGAHRLPIDGTLDLHAFRPSEAAALVADYLDACHEAGILAVRVVHGKGTGALRRTVEAALARHPRVEGFRAAEEGAGGWGATLVTLRR